MLTRVWHVSVPQSDKVTSELTRVWPVSVPQPNKVTSELNINNLVGFLCHNCLI